eukprot:1156363-Pelagomonas_calceolata.AAC.7
MERNGSMLRRGGEQHYGQMSLFDWKAFEQDLGGSEKVMHERGRACRGFLEACEALRACGMSPIGYGIQGILTDFPRRGTEELSFDDKCNGQPRHKLQMHCERCLTCQVVPMHASSTCQFLSACPFPFIDALWPSECTQALSVPSECTQALSVPSECPLNSPCSSKWTYMPPTCVIIAALADR